jgi:hypothetical protein
MAWSAQHAIGLEVAHQARKNDQPTSLSLPHHLSPSTPAPSLASHLQSLLTSTMPTEPTPAEKRKATLAAKAAKEQEDQIAFENKSSTVLFVSHRGLQRIDNAL